MKLLTLNWIDELIEEIEYFKFYYYQKSKNHYKVYYYIGQEEKCLNEYRGNGETLEKAFKDCILEICLDNMDLYFSED